MKKNLLFLFTALLSICIHAQMMWAPDGATWYYEYGSMCYFGYTKVTVEGDTLINEITCRKLRSATTVAIYCMPTPFCCFESTNEMHYTYADADRIYLWTGSEFEVLFDFTLGVGDSYSVGAEGLCPLGVLNVTATGTMQINDFDLRYYDFEMESYETMYMGGRIIERVGVIGDGYLFPKPGCMLDYGGSGPFRCYYDPEFGNYNSSSTGIPCDFILSDDQRLDEPDILLYPNPAASTVTIECNNYKGHFEVLNSTGQIISGGNIASNKTILDMSDLPSGLYFVVLASHDARRTYKPILKE